MMPDALAHLVVERLGRGDEKAARTWRVKRQRERVCAFPAARASGYQRYGAHPRSNYLLCACSDALAAPLMVDLPSAKIISVFCARCTGSRLESGAAPQLYGGTTAHPS